MNPAWRKFMAGIGALVGSSSYRTDGGLLISSCCGQDGRPHLSCVDAVKMKIQMSESIPFMPHSFTQIESDTVAGIEKHGPRFVLYDFEKNKVLGIQSVPSGYVVNGHAVFWNGQLLLPLVSETDSYALLTSKSGSLMPFDLKTMNSSNPIECFGYGPHDVKLIGDRLLVANSGGPDDRSTLSVFKPGRTKAERIYEAPENYSFRHIFPDRKDVILVLSEVGNESHIGCSYAYLPDHRFKTNSIEYYHFMKSTDGRTPIEHASFTRINDHGFLCLYQENTVAKFDVAQKNVVLLNVEAPQGIGRHSDQLVSLSQGDLGHIDRTSGRTVRQLSEDRKIKYFCGHTFQMI